MLWPEEFAKHEDLVKNDLIGFVKGTLDRRRDPAELVITKIIPLERGPRRALARASSSRSARGCTRTSRLERLLRQVRVRPGQPRPLPGDPRPGAASAAPSTRPAPSLKIRHDDRLLADLEAAVGAGNVRLLGHRGATARVEPVATVATPAPTEADYLDTPYDGSDDD